LQVVWACGVAFAFQLLIMSTRTGVYEEVREVYHGRAPKGNPLSQLCGSLCCSCVGVLLYFGALAGVALNEKGTVCMARAINAAHGEYQTVGCAAKHTEPSRGTLIYFACPLAKESLPMWQPKDFTGADWLDGAFNLQAVSIKQEVDMYQCKEKKESRTEKRGDKTVVIDSWKYNLQWDPTNIDSSNFKAWSNEGAHQALMRGCGHDFKDNTLPLMRSQDLRAPSLFAGTHDVSRHITSISIDAPVPLRQGTYLVPQGTGVSGRSHSQRRIAKDGEAYTRGEFIDYYGEARGTREWDNAKQLSGGGGGRAAAVTSHAVQTCSSNALEVGCLRVSYRHSSATHVSHLAAAAGSGQRTEAWVAPATWLCGQGFARIDLFETGHKSGEELLASAEAYNTSMSWVGRVVGVIAAVVGVMLFFQPIQTIANLVDQFFDWFGVIPIVGRLLDFLGDVVSGAVGVTIAVISIGIGAPSALAVLSIAWCIMRPLLGIPMLGGCIVLLWLTLQAMVSYARQGRACRPKRE